jgi:Protein of unknown function (DUF3667)
LRAAPCDAYTRAQGNGTGIMQMSKPDGLTADAASCQNCGSTLQGKYCCSCGQRAHVHRSLSAIGHDLAHGVLHIDGKIWNTLPLLLLKPGELTRRYIAGERVKFLSPMGLYLFSIFLLFAVMALAPSNELPGVTIKNQSQVNVPGSNKEGNAKDKANDDDDSGIVITRANTAEADASWFENKARKGVDNREMLAYKIKSNGYKLAWALIPLSLPFMWLVMIGRRGYFLYDHAVFVTYSISFMGLLASLAAAIGAIPNLMWIEVIMLTIFPLTHIFFHLKASYQLGRVEAFLRLSLLMVSILTVITIYLILLFFMGIL